MILDQLYTTDLTSGNLKLTARIENIPIDTEDFTPAYWLGWMKNTNLPQIFYVSKMNIDGSGDNAVLSFTDATDWSVNRDIGYMGQTDNSSGYASPMHMVYCRYDSTAAKWVVDFTGNNKFARLINNMRYQEFSYKYIKLTFGWAVYGVNSNGSVSGSTVTLTIDQLIDFVNGDYDISLTVSNYSVTLNISDFNDDYIAYVGDNNDIPLCIVSYEFQKYLYSTNYTQYANIIPMVSVPYNDDDNVATDIKCCDWSAPHIISSTNIVTIKNLGITNEVLDSTGISLNGTTDFDAPRYLNGAYGTFTVQELNAMTTSTPPVVSGNMIAIRRDYWGNSFYSFVVALNPSLILKHAGLFRWGTHDTNYNVAGYNANDIYYPEVILSTNEFTGNLLTGDEAYVKPRIPIWMKYEVTENDYDPADKPEPEPPVPEDGEESGDSVPNQYRYFGASKFITQYALTRSQLELFGEKLWTSWADTLGDPTEMWKNFKMFIGGGGDTGSIDIASAMQFIVSLRVFPYDLTDSLMVDVNGIRLGRGEYPIDVGTVKKMISLIQYVDFGTITVPRPFGDYRDYENMNISLVLPYCGTTMLNAGDVVGRTLTCTYAVDLQSGTCEAFVYVTATGDTGEHLYNVAQMSGQIGALLPVSATNSGQIMTQRITDAASVAATIAAPLNEMPIADMIAGGDSDPDLSNASNISPLLLFADPKTYKSISSVANALSRPAISCPSLGGGSGLSAFHQPASPYIQMRYGKYTEPDNYNHAVGRPSTNNGTLSSYSGYVVCANVDVSSLTCHSDEKAAIKVALESGVYV